MNKKVVYPVLLLTLGMLGSFFVFFIQASAQKAEEIVPYLVEKFRQENIPVVEIMVTKQLPLHLRVVVLGANRWSYSTNSAFWTSMQRVVFLDARQDGYRVESLIGILQNSQGEQLDSIEQDAGQVQFDRLVTPRPPLERLTNEETKELLIDLLQKSV